MSKQKEETEFSRIQRTDYLSTGHTLTNLALSGKWYGGILKGYYFWFWGDSDSGKSIMAYQAAAEACMNTNFDDYNIIIDVPEQADLIDIRSLYGNKLADRAMPPQGTQEDPQHSRVSEEFYYNLDTWLKQGPCIYILDSETGLDSKQGKKKFDEQKKAFNKGTKAAGNMGDGKAIVNSTTLRKMIGPLKETGSILFVISQARIAIGPMAQFIDGGKVTSGGEALRFFATCQTFISRVKSIKVERGEKRKISIGTKSRVHVKRSRITGKERVVYLNIYNDFGVDDLGDCVDFLIEEGHWKKTKGIIKAEELDGFTGDRETLIKYIEETDSENQLRKIVQKAWNQIEQEVSIQRKPRYE